jgi:hypothetical protein
MSKKAYKPGKVVKPKRACCRSGPRCKRCPVALKRLAKRGLAERRSDGSYVILELVPKRERKLARER